MIPIGDPNSFFTASLSIPAIKEFLNFGPQNGHFGPKNSPKSLKFGPKIGPKWTKSEFLFKKCK